MPETWHVLLQAKLVIYNFAINRSHYFGSAVCHTLYLYDDLFKTYILHQHFKSLDYCAYTYESPLTSIVLFGISHLNILLQQLDVASADTTYCDLFFQHVSCSHSHLF